MGRWPSSQWQQTVNLSTEVYGGANPSLPKSFYSFNKNEGDILAIEFYDGYISIVIESNLVLPEEIKKFVEDCEEACSIRMPAVVLDMRNVKEINSAGISKILKLYKDLQSIKIKLFMVNVDESINQIFKDLMLFALIKTFDNTKEFLL